MSVEPRSVVAVPGDEIVFHATVTGIADDDLVWHASGGEIVGSGTTATFVAPDAVGSFEVTVASTLDPSVSASASVEVHWPPSVSGSFDADGGSVALGGGLRLSAPVAPGVGRYTLEVRRGVEVPMETALWFGDGALALRIVAAEGPLPDSVFLEVADANVPTGTVVSVVVADAQGVRELPLMQRDDGRLGVSLPIAAIARSAVGPADLWDGVLTFFGRRAVNRAVAVFEFGDGRGFAQRRAEFEERSCLGRAGRVEPCTVLMEGAGSPLPEVPDAALTAVFFTDLETGELLRLGGEGFVQGLQLVSHGTSVGAAIAVLSPLSVALSQVQIAIKGVEALRRVISAQVPKKVYARSRATLASGTWEIRDLQVEFLGWPYACPTNYDCNWLRLTFPRVEVALDTPAHHRVGVWLRLRTPSLDDRYVLAQIDGTLSELDGENVTFAQEWACGGGTLCAGASVEVLAVLLLDRRLIWNGWRYFPVQLVASVNGAPPIAAIHASRSPVVTMSEVSAPYASLAWAASDPDGDLVGTHYRWYDGAWGLWVIAASDGSVPMPVDDGTYRLEVRGRDASELETVAARSFDLRSALGAVSAAVDLDWTPRVWGEGSYDYEVVSEAAWLTVTRGATGVIDARRSPSIGVRAHCDAEPGARTEHATLTPTMTGMADEATTLVVRLACVETLSTRWLRQVELALASVDVSTTGNVIAVGRSGGAGFVASYLPSGHEAWSTLYPASGWTGAVDVAVDSRGQAVVVGDTSVALAGYRVGANDAYVRKHGASGDVVWTVQLGDEGGAQWAGMGVAVDPWDNVLIVAEAWGTVENQGLADSVVVKLDPAGREVWRRRVAGGHETWPTAVTTDAGGNVVVVGYGLGPGGTSSAGPWLGFVRKYGPAGNLLWSHVLEAESLTWVDDVAVDAAGNVFVVGTTGAATDQEAGFVRKLDAAGRVVWDWRGGPGVRVGAAFGVAVDAAGNAFVVGRVPGVQGGTDAFVAGFRPDGTLRLFDLRGGVGDDGGLRIALAGGDGLAVVGYARSALAGVTGSGPSLLALFGY